jgi:hypothetical protein
MDAEVTPVCAHCGQPVPKPSPQRAVWIEPRNGIHGQVIDKRCRHKPIAYEVKRKGD